MGQSYSVYLKIKTDDKEGAKKALQNKIAKGKEERVNYNLKHYQEIGVDTETLEGLLQVFFGGWGASLKESVPGILSADFDCCYGWETIMMTAFEIMAPFLDSGSSIEIYPDSGLDKGIVKNGKVNWKA